jgi:hypothetical protein
VLLQKKKKEKKAKAEATPAEQPPEGAALSEPQPGELGGSESEGATV